MDRHDEPNDAYGDDLGREIPISFEKKRDGVVVTIGSGDTKARTKMSEEDAKLAIPRLIDELGAWGEFDAP